MSTDGGPAFPGEDRGGGAGGGGSSRPGMSLRDYFAGQALAAGVYHVWDSAEYAAKCYVISDAMLAERAKTSP